MVNPGYTWMFSPWIQCVPRDKIEKLEASQTDNLAIPLSPQATKKVMCLQVESKVTVDWLANTRSHLVP